MVLLVVVALVGIGSILSQQDPVRPRSAKAERTRLPKNEIRLFVDQIANLDTDRPCKPTRYGIDWGAHWYCPRSYSQPCSFISVGIGPNWSFDKDFSERTGCRGFAIDPSVTHKSELEPNVFFFQAAARSLDNDSWPLITTVPAFKKWLGLDRLSVLKFDGEGSEFSLGPDIEREDPDFFFSVDQVSIEFHLCRKYLRTVEHLDGLILLLKQLRVAGFRVAHIERSGCSPKDEETGCLPELEAAGYPCRMKELCPTFLFVKV